MYRVLKLLVAIIMIIIDIRTFMIGPRAGVLVFINILLTCVVPIGIINNGIINMTTLISVIIWIINVIVIEAESKIYGIEQIKFCVISTVIVAITFLITLRAYFFGGLKQNFLNDAIKHGRDSVGAVFSFVGILFLIVLPGYIIVKEFIFDFFTIVLACVLGKEHIIENTKIHIVNKSVNTPKGEFKYNVLYIDSIQKVFLPSVKLLKDYKKSTYFNNSKTVKIKYSPFLKRAIVVDMW